MQNFVFHNPVKVIFGSNTIPKIGAELKALANKALIVYGKGSIFSTTVYDQVVDSLEQAGVSHVDHGGVTANPLLSHVRRGIDAARRTECSVILGIGGGSVIDTAKAISAGVHVNHDVWKFFTGKKSVRQTLPVICIPTTAGSGSEMNSGMVLTHDEKQYKFGFAHRNLYPSVCIADPTYTMSLSPQQTAYGTVDTISHCLEAYFSTSVSAAPLQFRLMENICRTSIETLGRLLQNPLSYEDRATMLWTASISLSGLVTAGLGKLSFPMHVIEHAISAQSGVAHGAGLAAVIPGWLTVQQASIRGRLACLGREVFDLDTMDEKNDALATIEALVQFLKRSGCPVSLKELGVLPQHFPDLTEHCREQARIWRMKDFDSEQIASVLEACYEL